MVLAALFAAATAQQAGAQFSMNSIGRDAGPTVAIPVNPSEIDADVINDTHARLLRKQRWHAANAVDYKMSLTGMVTQYNKSWTTNNQNSVSGELAAYYYHTFTRDKFISTFKFDGIYGMNFIDDVWFKNQDVLKLYYLISWKMRERGVLKNWAYGFDSTFASQFSPGFKGRTGADRDVVWSNFLAPGALTLGFGLTYTSPNRRLPFIVTINPISGNGLFVLDERLDPARRQALGIAVTYAPDDTEKAHPIFKNYKLQGGSSLNVSFDRTFAMGGHGMTLQYKTTLYSFYGWITQTTRHKPIDTAPLPEILPTVKWDNALVFNPLRFLAVEFRTTTIYDRSQIDKVQMQYYLRLGLTYRYKNR
jgi:hypothetical protein